MLFYLIQTNFVDFAILIFFYIFIFTNRTFDLEITRRFLLAALLANILVIADSLDYYFSSFQTPTVLRYITSATGYSLRPGAIVFILLNLQRNEKNRTYYLLIPCLINAALSYSSVFTKLVFYFDDQNQFHRGILGILPFAVSAYYMIVLSRKAIFKYRMGAKKECAVIFLVAFMSVVSVCMETFFHFKFLINGIGGISIVFYYLFLHTQTFKRDALTNALNRHSFYIDIESLSRQPMIIISLDLNNLKTINDQQGHAMGDKAILTVVNCIYDQLRPGCKLYRMGGDEFTILCPRMTLQDADAMARRAVDAISSNGYEIAWGSTIYEPYMNFEKMCSISDAKMYACKKAMKNGNVR